MPWEVYIEEATGERHVVPDFGRKHELDIRCWCQPRRDEDDPSVIVHWSHESVAEFKREN